MRDLPIYLINLDGSDDRLTTATAALQTAGAAFERHPAFDGRGRGVAAIPQYDPAGASRFMGRQLSGGEIGCFISHVEAARRFLETSAPFGLVLEDDMSPLRGAMDAIDALTSGPWPPDWHLAHLAADRLKHTTPLNALAQTGVTLHHAHYFPMRTTALLWSRAGAEGFVQSAYPITAPIDIHLRRWLQRSDKGVATHPALFGTTQAASEIEAAGDKRTRRARELLYTPKRLLRMVRENIRARMLQRAARSGTGGSP